VPELRGVGGVYQLLRLLPHHRLQFVPVPPQGGLEISPQLLVGLAVADVDVGPYHSPGFPVGAVLDDHAAGLKPRVGAVLAQHAKLSPVGRGLATQVLVDLDLHGSRVVRVNLRACSANVSPSSPAS